MNIYLFFDFLAINCAVYLKILSLFYVFYKKLLFWLV